MRRFLTYTSIPSLLIGCLLLWRGIHDVWFIDETRVQWEGQTLPQRWKETLLWVHLGMQVSIGTGLWASAFWRPLRPYALGGATLLFAMYTVYSELALLERLPRKPCACIGWWEGSTWPWLVGANALLFLITVTLIIKTVSERRGAMT
ncbi:MauE/DoxX family redox-associated membrane protein [Parapedobacter sp. 2B3]|uniref:MauE/DoxX family redox-associated membrane protein n=1 Tax=Parapedobacter sp. 2B3 TaxID=3342381 RepID=UPI0035B678B3